MSRKSLKLAPTWKQLADIGADISVWQPVEDWMVEQELDRIGPSIIASNRPSCQVEARIHWRLIVACDVLGLPLIDGLKQLQDSLTMRAFCGVWFDVPPDSDKALEAAEDYRVQLSEALDECYERWVLTPRANRRSRQRWMNLLDKWAERRANAKAERQRIAREAALDRARRREAEKHEREEIGRNERQRI